MNTITVEQFQQVDIRVGVVLTASSLENARTPAYVLTIDFGPEVGVLKSSTQVTDLYQAESLIGKQVIAVTNFPDKQIGNIQSQCLVTGFSRDDGKVVLAVPDSEVPLGAMLA